MIREKIFREVMGLTDDVVVQSLTEASQIQSLKKGEVYIYRGEPELYVGFLLSGAVKSFLIGENGKSYVNCLETRPYYPLLTNGSGANAPALMNIQMITDTEILKLPMSLVWQLKQENHQVADLYEKWVFKALKEHQEHKQMLCRPTEDRLRWLLETRPDIMKLASQKDIAQFLNMTPERFSTVKHQILQEKEADK